jgi:hypothetical protein
MRCVRCQHDSPSHAKFCVECGARLGTAASPQAYVPRHLAEKILTSRSAFFLEEAVRELVETGTLAGQRGAYPPRSR